MSIGRKTLEDIGDASAGMLTIGVMAEIVPVILGVLGILWFVVRFANWYRVAFLGRKPWPL